MQPRTRRQLKPRRPEVNVLDWDDDEDAEPDAEDLGAAVPAYRSGDPADRQESNSLVIEGDGIAVYKTREAWHESLLSCSLENEQSGIWIPRWVGRGVKNAKLARVLSQLLWWFGAPQSDLGGELLCRARGRDKYGTRVLVTSHCDLARQVNIERRSVATQLVELKRRGLIRVQRPTEGDYAGKLLINLVPHEVAAMYCRNLGKAHDPAKYKNKVAWEELLDPKSEYQQIRQQLASQSPEQIERLHREAPTKPKRQLT